MPHHSKQVLTDQQRNEHKYKVCSGYLKDIDPTHLQTDDEGAYSFSLGTDSKYLCRYVHSLLEHLECPLVVTDAGAGAGCDSMQFVAAVTDESKEKMFRRVTSIEIDSQRQKYLQHNLAYVHKHHCTENSDNSTEIKCIHANYNKHIDTLHQHIVHIDPPWGGASSNEMSAQDLCLLDGEGGFDAELTVLQIMRRLKLKNESCEDTEATPKTRLLVVKTPSNWHPKVLHELCDAAEGYHRRSLFKYDYWVFYLCPGDYKHDKMVKDEFKAVVGFDTWRVQQAQLLTFFPFFRDDEEFKISDKRPMFLQNIWEDPPTNEGRRVPSQTLPSKCAAASEEVLDALTGTMPSEDNAASADTRAFNLQQPGETNHHYAWRTCCVHKYQAGALHSHYNLHNGEKKLLESSLFTMMYGLKRIKSVWKNRSWDDVLDNTLVLYVGAAGQCRDTHHFNELIKAIPRVHFACYDIRALESTICPDVMKERVTVFHKIFTNGDLDRWVAFSKLYTNKAIIFISDIRSDWSQALTDMEASKEVARMKLKQMMCFEQEGNTEGHTETREQVHALLAANEVISESVDRHIEIDNFVQWSWFKRMAGETKNVAIYSAKTREPYMRTNKKLESYHHFPGAELFQSATRSSTETRTQITAKEFSLPEPKSEHIRSRTLIDCIKSFFNEHYGDKTSFLTENIDYAKEYQNELDAKELWSMLPSRSVALHDMKFAWYNDDYSQGKHKGAADAGIRKMYTVWREDYVNDGRNRDARKHNTFDVERWCSELDARMRPSTADADEDKHGHDAGHDKHGHKKHGAKRAHTAKGNYKNRRGPQFKKIQMVNLDETGRGTAAHINSVIDRYTETLRKNKISESMIKLTHGWFSTWAAMRRYHKQLIRTDNTRLWDVSVQALQTLLVLDIGIHTKHLMKMAGASRGPQTVENYKVTWLDQHALRGVKTAQKHAKNAGRACKATRVLVDNARNEGCDGHDGLQTKLLKQQDNAVKIRSQATARHAKFNAIVSTNGNMPANHIQAQLQFNLINPYALKMYAELRKDIGGRYDSIRSVLSGIAKSGTVMQQLLFSPGSAHGTDDVWLKRRLQMYGSLSSERLAVARDWYCYWLKPLLDDHDNGGLKHRVSVEQIASAVAPYMQQRSEATRGEIGHCLGGNGTELLALHKWPLGKPVLFFACEKGSIPMIDFCLSGLSPAAIVKHVNTPRKRVMRSRNGRGNSNLQPENYPLHIAAYWGHEKAVAHLVKLGANQLLENHWLETPFLCAKEGLAEAKFNCEVSEEMDGDVFKSNETRTNGCDACMHILTDATQQQIDRANPAAAAAKHYRAHGKLLQVEPEEIVEENSDI